MSIDIDTDSYCNALSDAAVHMLPCTIEYDGKAKVAQYFTTGIRPRLQPMPMAMAPVAVAQPQAQAQQEESDTHTHKSHTHRHGDSGSGFDTDSAVGSEGVCSWCADATSNSTPTGTDI